MIGFKLTPICVATKIAESPRFDAVANLLVWATPNAAGKE